VRLTLTSLVALAPLLLVAPLTTDAQLPGKISRIGVLAFEESGDPWARGLREGLHELGHVEGQTIAVEWRRAPDETRYRDFAAELVRLKVDLIVAGTNVAIQAVQKATGTIPIVMVQATDPVGLGFVASLARPGGNITGLTAQSPELASKRLQLLKEAVPNLRRVAILWDPTPGWGRHLFSGAEAAAPTLGLRLQLVEARNPSELKRAFSRVTSERADALFYPGSGWQGAHRAQIAEYAMKSRLPTMCGARHYVEAGCLMSYAANFSDLWRRAAYFVDKVLRGAKPADLPVEQPSRFELVINQSTAKTLGLTIPPSVLRQADHVIE
jgi:putative ABC transport system substrate-binding protein